MARLYSIEADSVLSKESIFFVTTDASFGTGRSGRGFGIVPEGVDTNLTNARHPGSQRDQSAPQLKMYGQENDVSLLKCVRGSQINDDCFGSTENQRK